MDAPARTFSAAGRGSRSFSIELRPTGAGRAVVGRFSRVLRGDGAQGSRAACNSRTRRPRARVGLPAAPHEAARLAAEQAPGTDAPVAEFERRQLILAGVHSNRKEVQDRACGA
jgi:hypothetical protein